MNNSFDGLGAQNDISPIQSTGSEVSATERDESVPGDMDSNVISGKSAKFQDSEQLRNLSDQIRNGIDRHSTRDVLESFGHVRRGRWVNKEIEGWLKDQGLEMEPPIGNADFYGTVTIKPVATESGNRSTQEDATSQEIVSSPRAWTNNWILSNLKSDPTGSGEGEDYLDRLEYGQSVEEALDILKAKGRSKLPLFFEGNTQTALIGTVTPGDLAAEINRARNANESPKLERAAVTRVPVVKTDELLLDWVPAILEYGFIYGKDHEDKIVQIYTARDVASRLHSIAAMFVRANETEDLIRKTLARIPDEELKRAIDRTPGDLKTILDADGKPILASDDFRSAKPESYTEEMQFAQYIKAIGFEEIWEKYFASKDDTLNKAKCIRSLNDARLARNAVMHFNPAQDLDDLLPQFEAPAVWLRKFVKKQNDPTT